MLDLLRLDLADRRGRVRAPTGRAARALVVVLARVRGVGLEAVEAKHVPAEQNQRLRRGLQADCAVVVGGAHAPHIIEETLRHALSGGALHAGNGGTAGGEGRPGA